MSKLVVKGADARKRLKNGIAALTDAVASTMSASGSNVIIDTPENQAFVTGDGISVAEAFTLIQPIEEIGVAMAKHSCRQANYTSNDGTTAAMVLTNEFLQNDYIVENMLKPRYEKGMRKALNDVLDFLKDNTYNITNHEELVNIATISARGDREMGQLIADAFKHTEKDGQIIVEESRDNKSSVEYITGYQIDKGYSHELYVNRIDKGLAEFENPYILITDIPIDDIKVIEKFLKIALSNNRPIIIICPELSSVCEITLKNNVIQNVIKGAHVITPDFGFNQEMYMTDLAYLTGGKFISYQKGDKLIEAKIEDLGTCKKSLITKNFSVFIDFQRTNEEVSEYIESSLLKSEDEDFNKRRISRLKGRLSKIKVGAKTPVEMREKRDRVDDACGATKSALEEGYVVGGGLALYRASMSLQNNLSNIPCEEERAGYKLVLKSIRKPLNQILDNLFKKKQSNDILVWLKLDEKSKIIKHIEKGKFNTGYDVKDLELCDFISKGIIDPVKVIKSSLQAAFSVSITIMSTDVVIAVVGENEGLVL